MLINKKINDIVKNIARFLGVSPDGFKKYSSTGVWLLTEKFVTMGIAFFVGIAIARYLGPERYGILSYAITIYAIIFNFSSLGLDDLVLKDALMDEKKVGKIFGTAFYIRLFFAVLLFIIAAVLAYFKTDEAFVPIIIIVISAVFMQPISLISLYFMMEVKGKLRAVSYLYAYLITAVFKVVLIIINAPLEYFALAFFLDVALAMIFLTIMYLKNKYSFADWKFDKTVAVDLFKKGWPLIFIFAIGTIFVKIDIMMIEHYLGATQLGIYSVAVKLMEAWQFIPIVITTSLFPALVKSKQNEVIYYKRLSDLFALMTIGSVALGVVTTFLAAPIIYLMFGYEYIGAVAPLRIIIWCLTFISLHQITYKWMMMDNLIILGLYRAIFGVILNIVLNIILIKRYGITGSAAATLISYIFMTYLADLVSKKTRRLFFIKTFSVAKFVTLIIQKKR